MEQEQLTHIKSLIDEILHLEDSQQKNVNFQIISNMDVLMKYKGIEIMIRKVHPTTTMDYVKTIPGHIADMVLTHPLKLLGFLTFSRIIL